MDIGRRNLLKGVALAASAAPLGAPAAHHNEAEAAAEVLPEVDEYVFKFTNWTELRNEFYFDWSWYNFAGFLLATRPKSVEKTIDYHRQRLRRNPAVYLREGYQMETVARQWAGKYLGVKQNQISLTDNTTMGLATMYNGISIRPDQEILSTEHEHYSSVTSLKYRSEREGFKIKTIRLYGKAIDASSDEILQRIRNHIKPQTRVLALTWVHSGSSVKIPIAAVGELVATVNKGRKEDDRLLFCVDGVHGFGVEDIQFDDIGCDYFVAGTHKWMFGPSGTGIMCSRDVNMQTISPTIPAFNFGDDLSFGPTMTPGGFHSFEHRWALHRAFQFHLQIGKRKIQDRIRELNTYLKTRLDDAPNVELMTPMSTELSAGFTFFGVDGMDPEMVTERLLAQHIVVSPADRDVGPVVRMAPGLLNNHGEIDYVMKVLAKLPHA